MTIKSKIIFPVVVAVAVVSYIYFFFMSGEKSVDRMLLQNEVVSIYGETYQETVNDEMNELKTILSNVMSDPDYTYLKTFVLDIDVDTWAYLVDDPLIIAERWESKEFAPKYKLSVHELVDRGEKGKKIFLIEDSTGLTGKVYDITPPWEGYKLYRIEGKLNHWAVPFLNEGTLVIAIKPKTLIHTNQTHLLLALYMKSGNIIGEVLMSLVDKVITSRINSRINNSISDLNTIFRELEPVFGRITN